MIDAYLGPWGAGGYPLGYGKKYCILFNLNSKLSTSDVAKAWVDKTTIALQEGLRDFIVNVYSSGRLGSLTEPQLRAAAFNMHPNAYLRGGLAQLTLGAWTMVPIIATIPGVEFSPTSKDFVATWKQVFPTGFGVAVTAITYLMPAHSGIFAKAYQADRDQFNRENWDLRMITRRFEHGELEDIKALITVEHELQLAAHSDREIAIRAHFLAGRMERRRQEMVHHYLELAKQEPEIGLWLDGYCPGWRSANGGRVRRVGL